MHLNVTEVYSPDESSDGPYAGPHWEGRRCRSRGARRRDRDAEGVEGKGNGKRVSPSPAD